MTLDTLLEASPETASGTRPGTGRTPLRVPRDEATGLLVVAARREPGPDLVVLDLRSADGAALPPWEPGAHVELRLTTPAGELRRQYSLCGSPDDPTTWRIAVLREAGGRGGSDFVHRELAVGTAVAYAGPRNHFALAPSERYLFVSGGIGITPILPMVRAVSAAGRPWSLVHCARSAGRVGFARELTELASLTSGGTGRVVVHLDDRDGLLDLDALLTGIGAETTVYACGPAGLLTAVEARADRAAWRFRSEQFSALATDDTEDRAAADREVEVVVASTGDSYRVPVGRSILHTLNDAGLDLPYSCAEGECGSCEVGVRDGIPDHRDIVLTREERAANDCLMPCVSRALSERLVLDL